MMTCIVMLYQFRSKILNVISTVELEYTKFCDNGAFRGRQNLSICYIHNGQKKKEYISLFLYNFKVMYIHSTGIYQAHSCV